MRKKQKILCNGLLLFMAMTLMAHARYAGVGRDSAGADDAVDVNNSEKGMLVRRVSGAITLTAGSTVESYVYDESSTREADDHDVDENSFTILDTSPDAADPVTVTVKDNASLSEESYAISIAPFDNGTVETAPPTAAIAGALVTITATPNSGFYRSSLTVVGDVTTDMMPVVGTAFVMPAEPVTVTAVFSPFVLPEDLLLGWDVNGLGRVPSVSSIANASGLTASVISIETSALSDAVGANAFNMSTWSTNGTLAAAIADASYYEFTVSAVSGNIFDINEIAWRINRSSIGPNTFALLSSVEGFTASNLIGSELAYTNTAASNLNPAFGDIGITGQTQVTFRIYGWGASGSTGQARVDNGGDFGGNTAPGLDFAVFGSVEINGAGPDPDPDPDQAEITGFTRSGTDFVITFTDEGGATYQLEYTADLTNPESWIGGPQGSSGSLTNVAPADPVRFYRLREVAID